MKYIIILALVLLPACGGITVEGLDDAIDALTETEGGGNCSQNGNGNGNGNGNSSCSSDDESTSEQSVDDVDDGPSFFGTFEKDKTFTTYNDWPVSMRLYSDGEIISFVDGDETIAEAEIMDDDSLDFETDLLDCTCTITIYPYWRDVLDCECDMLGGSCGLWYDKYETN